MTLDEIIDIEDRLRAVKRAAHGPARHRERVLVAAAGAAAALIVYLHWRAGRRA